MPTRLVLLTDDLLAEQDPANPAALAPLHHAGYAIAVLLQRRRGREPADPGALHRRVHEAGGTIDAFFSRGTKAGELTSALGEAAARWRIEAAQMRVATGSAADRAEAAATGARAWCIGPSPAEDDTVACQPDLAAFVATLLAEAEETG